MSLKITFNEEAFQKDSKSINHNPEFKKFNMRFHDVDLLIIDAIAKRDGTSRSQILNLLIKRALKSFLSECDSLEAFAIMKHADSICEDNKKSDLSFSWESWYIDSFYLYAINDYTYHVEMRFQEVMENNEASASLKNLVQALDKAD